MVRKVLDNYRVAIEVAVVVAILVAIRAVLWGLGVEGMDVSPLASSIVAGGVFVMGLVVAGTLSDYKDAERAPTDLAAGLDGTILLLCEDPPLVWRCDPATDRAERIRLLPGTGDALRDVLERSASAGEGLLPLRDGHLLVAKEKDPPLLVEFGPRDSAATGVAAAAFLGPGERWDPAGDQLHALAAWELDGVDDVSDLAFARGALHCLSDQSRRVVVVDLPLEPDRDRASAGEAWDLRVPERDDEPDGKPEGLVVTEDGMLIVGLDTRTPGENLCWYRPEEDR